MTVRTPARWMLLLLLGGGFPGSAGAEPTNLSAAAPSNSQPVRSSIETVPLLVHKAPGGDGTAMVADDRWVAAKRERLRSMLGAVDPRTTTPSLEILGSGTEGRAATELFSVQAVRWPVFGGVWGQGLWLRPRTEPVARVAVIPDADQSPESLVGLAPGLTEERQVARRLAENGCEVLVPVLIDRRSEWPGVTSAATNFTHRDWLCRQALGLGRHIIGYEVQKVLAAIDYFVRNPIAASERNTRYGKRPAPLAVVGYGEGGMLAFYCAALDPRISTALVSGYFDSPRRGWEGPLCRDVFGLLPEFRDAEVAALIAPRRLIVEHSAAPAPGGVKLGPVDYESVEAEFNGALARLGVEASDRLAPFVLISGPEGLPTGPGSDRALAAFLNAVGVPGEAAKEPVQAPAEWRLDAAARQREQFKQLETFTQELFRACKVGTGTQTERE